MPVDKRPSELDNLITEINGNEILVVDNGTVVGKMAISTIKSIFSKADIGLSNVDNTADSQKPVSGPQAAVLSGKSAIGHGHAISDVTDLISTIATSIASAVPNIDSSNIQNSIYVAELQW